MTEQGSAKAKSLAVIDLGSNTAILTIFASTPPLQIIHEEFRIPRLAQGLQTGGSFASAAWERSCDVLNEYQEIARNFHAEIVLCGGTAPFRKVADADRAIQELQQETGIRVRPLTVTEEAQLSYLAVVLIECEGKSLQATQLLVVDVGGGSTELTYGHADLDDDRHQVNKSISIAMGCVDLTESCLPEQLSEEHGSAAATLKRLSTTFARSLNQHRLPTVDQMVGVAGTPVSLALLQQGIHRYDPARADGVVVSRQELSRWCKRLATTPLHEKVSKYGIPSGRAEVIVAGLLILTEVMQHHNLKQMIVRNVGVRHGLALQVLGLLPEAYALS